MEPPSAAAERGWTTARGRVVRRHRAGGGAATLHLRGTLGGTTARARGQRVSTIFPEWPPSSISWWARATSSRGMVVSTIGRIAPEATSGQTFSTTPQQIAAFSVTGRARSEVAVTDAALAQQGVDVELALGAALHPDDDQPAAGGEGGDVAAEVLRAHVVEDDVGAAGLGEHLDEVVVAVVDGVRRTERAAQLELLRRPGGREDLRARARRRAGSPSCRSRRRRRGRGSARPSAGARS